MRVYLAGPDVFLPDPHARAAALKAICARYGLAGVSPLDALPARDDWAGLSEARRIALQNETHIAACDALIANLTPFRGPSADVGTVFELGFMRALGRPVFGWTNTARLFSERTHAHIGADLVERDGVTRDAEGLLVESFGLMDNLMIDSAILASGGTLETAAVAPGRRWEALEAFERCVAGLARLRDAGIGSAISRRGAPPGRH